MREQPLSGSATFIKKSACFSPFLLPRIHSGHQNQVNKFRDSFIYQTSTEYQTNARYQGYGQDFVLLRNLPFRSQDCQQPEVWSGNDEQQEGASGVQGERSG